MMRILIFFLIFESLLFSCKKNKIEKAIVEEKVANTCNADSLIFWSSEVIMKNKSTYPLSYKTMATISDDSTSIEVSWRYKVNNPDVTKDEYVEYCLSLINDKIDIPNDYELKFDYVLNAYCPVDIDLPIEVNSEIRNFKIIDNLSFTHYEFEIIRGRLDSGIKYVRKGNEKIKDTIEIKFRNSLNQQ